MTDLSIKQAGVRFLNEERASRDLSAERLRKSYGDRAPKAVLAELQQLDNEIAAIDVLLAAIDEGSVLGEG